MKIIKDLEKLNILNESKRIKLRYNSNSSGSLSLYLDFSNQKRVKEYLNIVLSGSDILYSEDKEKLRLAILLRDKKEIELVQNETGFQLHQNKIDFILYFEEIAKFMKNDTYMCSYKHFRKFFSPNILFIHQIDRKLCENFADYLSKSDLSSSTANLYFKKYIAVLNRAVKEKLLSSNPASGIIIKHSYRKREFLTEEELKILIKTDMRKKDTKEAFLFACFTGLRLSDLQKLKISDIKNGYLHILQQKTKEELRIKLSETAMKILNNQSPKKEFVFNLSDRKTIAQSISRWIKKAGLDKKITFHCSRHTFATLLLTKGVDIYAVSKLIGHNDLKTTQLYAKLIDKKKDEAISLLPDL